MADEKREGGNAERPFVKLVETGQKLAAEAKAREERLARQAELKQRLIAEQAARQGKEAFRPLNVLAETERNLAGAEAKEAEAQKTHESKIDVKAKKGFEPRIASAGSRVVDSGARIANAGLGLAKTSGSYILGKENIVGSNLFIALAVILYLLDILYFRFNGLDIGRFLTLMSGWPSIETIIGYVANGVIAVILIAYGVLNWGRISRRDFISFALLVEIGFLIFSFGGMTSIGGISHILFGILIYAMLIIPYYGNTANAHIVMFFAMFFDFFGYGLLTKFLGSSLIANRLTFPIWFYLTLYLTYQTKKNWFTKLLVIFTIAINVFYFAGGLNAIQDLSAGLNDEQISQGRQFFAVSLDNIGQAFKSIGNGIRTSIGSWWGGTLTKATGGLYGGADKTQQQPMGFTWDINNPDSLKTGSMIIVPGLNTPSAVFKRAALLKGKSEYPVSFSCFAKNPRKITDPKGDGWKVAENEMTVIGAQKAPKDGGKYIVKNDPVTVQCALPPEFISSFDVGIEKKGIVAFKAHMDGIVSRKETLKITSLPEKKDEVAVPAITAGSVSSTGAGQPFDIVLDTAALKNKPISLSALVNNPNQPVSVSIPFSIRNNWKGDVNSIESLVAYTPKGTSWKCGDGEGLFNKDEDDAKINTFTTDFSSYGDLGQYLFDLGFVCTLAFEDQIVLNNQQENEISFELELKYNYNIAYNLPIVLKGAVKPAEGEDTAAAQEEYPSTKS